MRTLRNQNGFVAYIPLIICCIFGLYVVGMLAWAKVDWWWSHNSGNAVEIEKTKADVEKRRIDLSEKQLGEVMDQNRQLISQNQDAMGKITAAHANAAAEIADAHKEASGRLATMAESIMAMKTDRTMVFILAGITLASILATVAAVFLLLRGRRYPEGPVILSFGGGTLPGRIASGADVYQLIEHKREAAR